MTKLKEIIERTSLRATGRRIGLDVRVVEGRVECRALDPDDERYSVDFLLPSLRMVEACRADAFDFFQPFIDGGKLTAAQMQHAAERYRLSKTKSGRPMFWMIDDMMDPLDARIGEAWISQMLKKREPLLRCWHPQHCLFGLHLLMDEASPPTPLSERRGGSLRQGDESRSVSIVEREEAAVVLSELFPESIWMAYVSLALLSVEMFAPLVGRTVTIFPCTDLCMMNISFFEDFAADVRRHYPAIRLSVDTTLEEYATEEQKGRHIDLLDFLIEN